MACLMYLMRFLNECLSRSIPDKQSSTTAEKLRAMEGLGLRRLKKAGL